VEKRTTTVTITATPTIKAKTIKINIQKIL